MNDIYSYLQLIDNSNNATFFKIYCSLPDLQGSLKIMSQEYGGQTLTIQYSNKGESISNINLINDDTN